MNAARMFRTALALIGASGAFAVTTVAAQAPAQPAPATTEFAVYCGRLHQGDGKVLPKVWLVVRNGKIASISAEAPPAGIKVIDASNKVVMPGLVLADNDLSAAADSAYNVSPDVMASEGFDFLAEQRDALSGGVTTAYLSPGRNRLVSGQGAVVKLAGTDLVRRVLEDSACLRVNLCDSAMQAPRVFEPDPHPTSDEPLLPSRIQLPTARIALLSELRELFATAKDTPNGLTGPGAAENQYDDSALFAVRDGKLPLRVAAGKAPEIYRALQLQRELACRMVLEDCLAIGTLATMAATQNACATFRLPVVPGAQMRGDDQRRKEPELPLDGPARAAAAGVLFALAPPRGMALRDTLLCGAIAIGQGLTADQALIAMTSGAAKVLGVAQRVGLLAPGMDADFLVLSGEPFAVGTMVESTWIDGERAFERKVDGTLLAVRVGRIHTGEGNSVQRGVLLVKDGRIQAVGADLPVPFGATLIDLPDGVMTPGFIDAFSHLGLAGNGTGVPGGAPNQPLDVAVAFDDPMFAPALERGITTVMLSGRDGGTQSGRIAAIKTGAADQSHATLRAIAGQRFLLDAIGPNAARPITEVIDRGRKYLEAWQAYDKALADFKAGKSPVKPVEPTPAPAPAEKPKDDPITGTWECEIDIQGRIRVNLKGELQLQGEKVTGTLQMSMQGRQNPPQEIENGTFSGGTLKLTIRMMGQEATVEAKVENDTMTGTITTPMGDQAFTGKRTAKPGGAPAAAPTTAKTGDDGAPKKPEVDENLEPIRAVLEGKATIVVNADRAGAIEAVTAALTAAKVPFALHTPRGLLDDNKVLGAARPPAIVEPDVVQRRDGELVNLASYLCDLGMPVAFGTGECGNARYLPLHAAYAVRYGMSPDDALAAITRVPAKMFQLDDRVGSLRKGKDADFVVFSGDPFEPQSRVLLVVVDGHVRVDRRGGGR